MNISVNLIMSHENNPRKDLGDLTELTESIRKNGILQPLTVVPCGDIYKVVIGHRRLAAAIQAGLEEVPCDVKNLTEEEQLNVMMMENMMRENLTTYEEAKGFQLMLDLGKTVEQVAEETGFCQSTIRNRTKLLSLNEKKFKESLERGATLTDLLKLYDIEDEHTRNAVLTKAGTAEFNSKLNQAVENEKRAKYYAEGKDKIATWATKVDGMAKLNEVAPVHRYYSSFFAWSSKVPESDEGTFYFIEENERITIYAVGEDTEEAARAERRQKALEIANELHAKAMSCYKLRTNYIKNFGNFRKFGKLIMSEFLKATVKDMARTSWRNLDMDALGKILNIDDFKVDHLDKLEEYPTEKVALAMLSVYNDKENACMWREVWNGEQYVYKYENNEKLAAWYQFLTQIGYHVSEEEVKFLNGEVEHVMKEDAA